MRNRIITKMALKIYSKLPEDIRTKISRDKFINSYLQDKSFLPLFIFTYILSVMAAIMIALTAFLISRLILGLIVPNTVFLVLAYILGFSAGPFTVYCHIKVGVKAVELHSDNYISLYGK